MSFVARPQQSEYFLFLRETSELGYQDQLSVTFKCQILYPLGEELIILIAVSYVHYFSTGLLQ